MEHIPVLQTEVLQMASAPHHVVKSICDGTFGRGGHSKALLEKYPDAQLTAFDCDLAAIEYGQELFKQKIASGQVKLVHANYTEIPSLNQHFDIILLDLGVSSPQLDQPARGFSFYHSGPLDMRMDQRHPVTAATIVNEWSAEDLMELFKNLGEIRRPHRVVNAIVSDRKTKPFVTTTDLSQLIERIEGWSRKGHHPATQFFLALRLQVNRELDVLKEALPNLVASLTDGGRLLVITFHSLEDRIVKEAFKAMKDVGWPVNKKVIQAQWPEKKSNPRARSAKLRVFQKGEKNESASGQ